MKQVMETSRARFRITWATWAVALWIPAATASGAPAVSKTAPSASPVLPGIDVLEGQEFALLKGKQVGLITNQTGVNSRGRSTADILAKAPGVKLIALFSPEHGIRGVREHGQPIGDMIDPRTRLPVYSLYGTAKKPLPAMLNAIDVLVFDMQDVGTRFYTYITTMGLALEAAAERKIAFVVLDRPNPLGGEVVEGQVLDPRVRHFTAYFSVPVRHGLTVGELARWYNQTSKLGARLTVVPTAGWKRSQLWPDTGLEFIPPSPNIRSPAAALLYSGIGIFESTNLSVGRGTAAPFEQFGAPWMDALAVAGRLNTLNLAGARFAPVSFVPAKDRYRGLRCSGVRIEVIDPRLIRPVDIFVQVAVLLRELHRADFQPRWDEMVRVTGSRDFETLYQTDKPASDILELFHQSAARFAEERKEHLLY